MCIVGAYFAVIFDFAQLILIKKELVEFLISSQIGYKRDIAFISLLPLNCPDSHPCSRAAPQRMKMDRKCQY